jgi:hypothetical protein
MKTKKIPWGIEKEVERDAIDLSNPYTFLKAFQGKIDIDFSSDAVKKEYKPFLINRFVSMNPTLVHIANSMNSCIDISMKDHIEFYKLIYPKKETGFFPYLKKKKTEEAVKDMNKYYSFGTKDSILAQKILSDEQLDNISRVYVGGRK